MIKSLYPKFQSWSEKGSVYLYSDPHFEDDDMIEYFGYATPEEQINNINRVVTKNDFICFLGDLGEPSFFNQIRCKNRIFILGNHDQSATKYIGYCTELYTGPLFIGEKILLSHEPIYGLPWCVNFHGHQHSRCDKESDTHINLCANIIEYKPVSLGVLIKKGAISNVIGLHRYTIENISAGQ